METVLLAILVTIVVGIVSPLIPFRVTRKIHKLLDALVPHVEVKEGTPPSKH